MRREDVWQVTVVVLAPAGTCAANVIEDMAGIRDLRLGVPLVLPGGRRRDFGLDVKASHRGLAIRLTILLYEMDASYTWPEMSDADGVLHLESREGSRNGATKHDLEKALAHRLGSPPVILQSLAADAPESLVIDGFRTLLRRTLHSLRADQLVDFAAVRSQKAADEFAHEMFDALTSERILACPEGDLVPRLLRITYERGHRACMEDRVRLHDDYDELLSLPWRMMVAVNSVEAVTVDSGIGTLFGSVARQEVVLAIDQYRAVCIGKKRAVLEEALRIGDTHGLWEDDKIRRGFQFVEDRLAALTAEFYEAGDETDENVYLQLEKQIRRDPQPYNLPPFGGEWDRCHGSVSKRLD